MGCASSQPKQFKVDFSTSPGLPSPALPQSVSFVLREPALANKKSVYPSSPVATGEAPLQAEPDVGTLSLLEKMHIFSKLSQPQLHRLTKLAMAHTFQPGEIVISQGSVVGSLHILDQGEASVTCDGIRVGTIEVPGQYFGAQALGETGTSFIGATITAAADRPFKCICLSQASVEEALGEKLTSAAVPPVPATLDMQTDNGEDGSRAHAAVWFVVVDRVERIRQGPMTRAALADLVHAKGLGTRALVWTPPMQTWEPFESSAELMAAMRSQQTRRQAQEHAETCAKLDVFFTPAAPPLLTLVDQVGGLLQSVLETHRGVTAHALKLLDSFREQAPTHAAEGSTADQAKVAITFNDVTSGPMPMDAATAVARQNSRTPELAITTAVTPAGAPTADTTFPHA